MKLKPQLNTRSEQVTVRLPAEVYAHLVADTELLGGETDGGLPAGAGGQERGRPVMQPPAAAERPVARIRTLGPPGTPLHYRRPAALSTGLSGRLVTEVLKWLQSSADASRQTTNTTDSTRPEPRPRRDGCADGKIRNRKGFLPLRVHSTVAQRHTGARGESSR